MKTTTSAQTGGYKDRLWIPRFWDGMTLGAWIPLLLRNGLTIHPLRVPMAMIVTLLGLMNSSLAAVQWLRFRRKIAGTQLVGDPIFIVGHWRSGTTMLHEMLILDQRHTSPTTYECFAPAHFLVSRSTLPRIFKFLLPARRPMDNMPAGWERPQEDEFALCCLGVPSPYLTMLFPNRPPECQEYLDLEGLPPDRLARWKERFLWFLQCVTLRRQADRAEVAAAHRPDKGALGDVSPRQFVHIVRDPYVVFASTVNLWKRLYKDQGLQIPRYRGLEEHVLETFRRMYATFERDRHLIPPGQFCEVRYEDLVKDPVGQMRMVYQRLELGEFDQVLPSLEGYLSHQADYQTNRYAISPEMRAEITRRWGDFCRKYGYAD